MAVSLTHLVQAFAQVDADFYMWINRMNQRFGFM